MGETRHIRLDYEEALNAKKQLLSTELNILHTIKRIKEYKKLRKKELTTKNKLKTTATSLKSKLNLILSTFPDEKGKPRTPQRTRRKKREEKEDLTKELEDIEKKLSRLK